MPIGYGVRSQPLPPLTSYYEIPKFHYNSRFRLCMDHKYFWNNKIIIIANYAVYRNEISELHNNYSTVYMFICYDLETDRNQYIKLEDLHYLDESSKDNFHKLSAEDFCLYYLIIN